MDCKQTREALSEYADTALPGSQMNALRVHLAGCSECKAEHGRIVQTRALVASIGQRHEPPALGRAAFLAELIATVRSVISRERAEKTTRSWDDFRVRFEQRDDSLSLAVT